MIRPLAWLAKELMRSYVDLIGMWVIFVGLTCLIVGAVLASFGIGGFAIAFMVLGASFVLLGYLGSKLMEWLLR
jgi:hypothetical protein